MKLRTGKKQKNTEYDNGSDGQQEQTAKKGSGTKNHSEKETHSSNENSNDSNENEPKNRHKLRNSVRKKILITQSSNYQGKYKKMNSGKYLYKVSQSEKRPPIVKKKQLRFIQNDLVGVFKKYLQHLYRKDEENMLNKKKKREEGKQKAKSEKMRNQKVAQQNYANMNMQPMMYSSELYKLNNGMIPNSYYAGQMFYLGKDLNYGYPFTPVEQQERTYNSESLEALIKKGIVNHIVAAKYIFEQQEKNKNKIIEQKKVPISTVNFNEGNEEDTQNKAQNQGIIQNPSNDQNQPQTQGQNLENAGMIVETQNDHQNEKPITEVENDNKKTEVEAKVQTKTEEQKQNPTENNQTTNNQNNNLPLVGNQSNFQNNQNPAIGFNFPPGQTQKIPEFLEQSNDVVATSSEKQLNTVSEVLKSIK